MKKVKRFASEMGIKLREFRRSSAFKLVIASYLAAVFGGMGLTIWQNEKRQAVLVAQIEQAGEQKLTLEGQLGELLELKSQDPYQINDELVKRHEEIASSYKQVARLFETRADLAALGKDSKQVELLLAKVLTEIGLENYASVSAIAQEAEQEMEALFPTPEPVSSSGSEAVSEGALAVSGYSRVKVATQRGNFVVAAVVAPGARVVVETAGETDCTDNCPTKTLAEHIASSGGFAGINGAYFCPPDYPRCAGKSNSFDTLAVNGRTKAVLNRDNNVYSVVPLLAAYGSNLSFYDRTLDWGVDTSSTGAIANYPRLVRGGAAASGEENGKGTRGFIGVKDGAVVIGHVFAASFAEAAEVLATLGLADALNLDGGGSSALWYEGSYRVGPGRSLPTAIVLTH